MRREHEILGPACWAILALLYYIILYHYSRLNVTAAAGDAMRCDDDGDSDSDGEVQMSFLDSLAFEVSLSLR